MLPGSLTELRTLETQIDCCMQSDRHRLRRLLRSIREASTAGKPFDRNLSRLRQELEQSTALRQQRQEGVPAVTFDESLPISARRDEIAAAIREHQVIIVSGETGSGKSTQLPKICLAEGRGIDGVIGHTQPRRIAARSVAARVAEELAVPLGRDVGFKIRFTDTTSPRTYVKLMTDGILLAESQQDRFLNQYDTIILDEAHERSLNIDFLIGYLKRLLPRRPDLKLIITSATIDAERFAEHFASTAGPAPVIEVSGRTYPVEVRWRPPAEDEDEDDPDWQQRVLAAVDEVASIDNGDILIFMPTERDIHETAKLLRARTLPGDYPGQTTEILPLYARLSSGDQNRVFQPSSHRRIVIATNVAESSLTVPGIRYVIDPGTARISRYSARSKMQRLPIEAVSQASADQRKGRCGRVGPGICIRLYSEQDYLSREKFTPPEIQRTNLASVILQTKLLGLGEIDEFPFLDPPKPEAIRDGYKTLFELGAIDEKHTLTPLGQKLGRIPVDPRIGRIILAGHDEGCLNEVLIIASALELQDPRERPLDKQQAADEAHAQFANPESDFLSYLKLWDFYHELKEKLSTNQLRKACRQNFLSYNRMREWVDLHRQLRDVVERSGFKQQDRRDDYNAIHRALLTGLLSSVGFRGETNEYTVAGGSKVFLWPGSATFEKKPKWIVAAELVETTRRYVRTVARIDPGWIERLAPHLVTRSYSEPHWEPERAGAVAYEKVSLFGLVIVPRRRVNYGSIDPARARELFIEHGLVEGTYVSKGAFQKHNQELLAEIETQLKKTRQPGLLLGDETRYEFFDHRIPADVYDGPRFEKWRREAEQATPRLLYMSKADLVEEQAEEPASADFPSTVAVRQMQLPLDYRFEPGAEQDGVTLTVPMEALNQLDPQRLGWLVPGLLEEKVVALIKSLPKMFRRQFVPAPETAREVVKELRFGEGSLTAAVAAILSRMSGEQIPATAFQESELPPHLRMNIQVVDTTGKPLATGRDLAELRQQLGAEASESFSAIADSTWNRDGLTSWDLEELPKSVDLDRNGVVLKGYPALLDQGESVALRLLDFAEQALLATRGGLRRLFVIAAKRELKAQVDWLPNIDQLQLFAATLPEPRRFKPDLIELVADRAFFDREAIPRTRAEFTQRMKAAHARIGIAVQDVTQLIGPLMQAYQEARVAVERISMPQWKFAAEDIRQQIAELVQPGFLSSTPWSWLLQYPRYFRGIPLRLQKLGGGGLERDRRNLSLVQPRWQAYVQRAAQHRELGIVDPELVYYRWMLEEFRISLFSQELGTAITVSEKRLDRQWEKVRRGT